MRRELRGAIATLGDLCMVRRGDGEIGFIGGVRKL
jgi:hypothetical protein